MGMIKLPNQSIKFFNENYLNIFESGNLAEGEWNRKVAEWACKYTSSDYALAVNSNGSGIYTILRLLKEYRFKKKVFLQSNTMYGVKTIAVSSGLDLCGYVDCSLDYLMPTFEQVKSFISNLSKPEDSVFLLTHIGGMVNPDIERIADLCKKSRVSLVEDCAHSLGSTLSGKHTGLFGDAGVYSLYATKAIPVGEGGIVVTRDQELFNMAHKFIMYDRFDQKLNVGINFRMSEINALLAFAVINETELIIENKYLIADKYIKACKDFGWSYINPANDNQRSNLYKFILLSRNENPEQDFHNIKTRTSPVYNYCLGDDKCEIINRHVCLPIWYGLEDSTLDNVVSELHR